MTQTKTILHTDDEDYILAQISAFLSKIGFYTLSANNGHDAISIFKQSKPDLVIIDYNMPEMNGIELLNKLKSIHKQTPVIMLSGETDIQVAVQALKNNAVDFLCKPVNYKLLESSIYEALTRSKLQSYESKYQGSLITLENIIHQGKDISILKVHVPLDEITSSTIKENINTLMEKKSINKAVILSLNLVEYINNIGFHLLLEINHNLSNAGHQMILSELSPAVDQFFKQISYPAYFIYVQELDIAISKILKNE